MGTSKVVFLPNVLPRLMEPARSGLTGHVMGESGRRQCLGEFAAMAQPVLAGPLESLVA
jgi:hypothetical protein